MNGKSAAYILLLCSLALLGLAFYFGGPAIASFLLILLGAAFVAIELLLLPGLLLFALLGVLSMLAGIGLLVWPIHTQSAGPLQIAGSLASFVGGMALLARCLPRLPLVESLRTPPTDRAMFRPAGASDQIVSAGDVGLVTRPLRPAGKARFGVEELDVTCLVSYVDPGAKVEVTEHRGMTIIVRPIADDAESG